MLLINDIGILIKKERTKAGLTQFALANMLNISQAKLCRIESGNVNVSAIELLMIAKTLDLSINHFVNDPNPERSRDAHIIPSKKVDVENNHLQNQIQYLEETLRLFKERNQELLQKIERRDRKIEKLTKDLT